VEGNLQEQLDSLPKNKQFNLIQHVSISIKHPI